MGGAVRDTRLLYREALLDCGVLVLPGSADGPAVITSIHDLVGEVTGVEVRHEASDPAALDL
jgi:hypothetical protein